MGDPRDGFTFLEDGTNRNSKKPKNIKVHTNRVDYFFNLTPKKFAKGLVQMSPKTAKKLIKALKKELK